MSQERAHRSWRTAERIKRLSDRLVGIGPFGVGLDGLLTWIPGAGGLYSIGAASLLMYEAFGAKVSPMTLARMLGYLAVDAATSEVPLVGDAVDLLFPGHLLAAKELQKDIEARHGVPETHANRRVRTPRGRRRPESVI
ncbi:MAG: DUF4112 domain-containing protein [Caulobacteraceae bacterium]|nr:DUF4112 domain-containing protein [Caulobacteraceae bacterium]